MKYQSMLSMDSVDKNFSKEIRELTLEIIFRARASHIGGAFSMVEILSVLYNRIMNINPLEPEDPKRDFFFLSKGHACTSLYATLALKGFFPATELIDKYATDGSIFTAHASHMVPGVELSTGSLGHALSVACGMTLGLRKRNMKNKCYVVVSDGELNEGSNWEAILFASHHSLTNLTLIVDYNKIQSLGFTDEVLRIEPLKDKFISFGWNVLEVDGHDEASLCSVFLGETVEGKPNVIIAHTVKGKGISFMENKLLWHYKSPSEEEYDLGLKELKV